MKTVLTGLSGLIDLIGCHDITADSFTVNTVDALTHRGGVNTL